MASAVVAFTKFSLIYSDSFTFACQVYGVHFTKSNITSLQNWKKSVRVRVYCGVASNNNGGHWQKLRTLKCHNYVKFTFILLENLKFVGRRESNLFIHNIHFVAPWTLLPGTVAPLAPFYLRPWVYAVDTAVVFQTLALSICCTRKAWFPAK